MSLCATQNCTPPRGTFRTHLSPRLLPSASSSPRTPPATHVTHTLVEDTNNQPTCSSQRAQEIDHLKKTVSLSGRCRRRHCLGRCHHFISWAANDTAGAARSVADPSGQSQVSGGGGGCERRRRRPGGGVVRTEATKILLLPFYVVVAISINTTTCFAQSSP